MTSTTILIDYLFVRFLVILGTAADVRTPQVQPFYISLFSVVIDLRSLGLVPGVFVGLWSNPHTCLGWQLFELGPLERFPEIVRSLSSTLQSFGSAGVRLGFVLVTFICDSATEVF